MRRMGDVAAIGVAAVIAAALLGGVTAGTKKRADYETRQVKVRIGRATAVLALADLEALAPVTLRDYQPVGTSRGPLTRNTWTGASLKDALLKVDPRFCDRAETAPAITIRSQDGWTVTLKWPEVCAAAAGGEALYDVKGCNECHGVHGEGTAPPGKPPAPALKGRGLKLQEVLPRLRAGGERHDKIDVYTESRLPESDLADILAWLDGSSEATPRYVVPPERRAIVLAYLKNGVRMTGREGLIQLVVAMDEFAGRYSHWVSEIEAGE